MSSEETSIYATKEDLEELKSDLKQIIDTVNILLEFEIKNQYMFTLMVRMGRGWHLLYYQIKITSNQVF